MDIRRADGKRGADPIGEVVAEGIALHGMIRIVIPQRHAASARVAPDHKVLNLGIDGEPVQGPVRFEQAPMRLGVRLRYPLSGREKACLDPEVTKRRHHLTQADEVPHDAECPGGARVVRRGDDDIIRAG